MSFFVERLFQDMAHPGPVAMLQSPVSGKLCAIGPLNQSRAGPDDRCAVDVLQCANFIVLVKEGNLNLDEFGGKPGNASVS